MGRHNSAQESVLFVEDVTREPPTMASRHVVEYIFHLLVALPTATLNGLAAVSGDAATAGSLHTPSDLKGLLVKASVGRIFYGVAALLASEAVLFFLNKRYLLASGKAAIDLLRRDALTLRSLCCCYDLDPRDRAGIAENGLLLWSIVTSLIFAEMGGKALSFFGLSGEIIGFSLSLSVYFATRFAGAKMFVANICDPNWRLKQHYAAKLELLERNGVPIRTDLDSEHDANRALTLFLNQVDTEWKTLPKDTKRVFWLQYVAPFLGYTLGALTVLPIISGFIPESIQGAELLTHSSIGANSHYQNAASFTFGAFATALTLFFYELNIKDLPKHFLRTALSIYEKIKSGDMRAAMKLFGLTVLAFGASYLSGIGFKFVADTAIANGYLPYLGSWLSSAMPDGLLTAVVAMLWSHLQDLINQTAHTPVPLLNMDMAALTHVNAHNAEALLNISETDISALRNRHTLFATPTHVDTDTNTSPKPENATLFQPA